MVKYAKFIKQKRLLKFLFLIFILLYGCSIKLIKYGYLPGGEYPFYKSHKIIDLKQKEINFIIMDKRNEFTEIECSKLPIERDSELEGDFGKNFFEEYLTGLIEHCNGKINKSLENAYKIDLEVLCPKMYGYGFIEAHGFVQFNVHSKLLNKRYSIDMKDGDEDSPIGKYSFITRKTAMRKMVSAAVSKAIEEYLNDIDNSSL